MEKLPKLGSEEAPVQSQKIKHNLVELTEVVTQTAPAYKLPTGETVGLEVYLVWMGNQIWQLNQKI